MIRCVPMPGGSVSATFDFYISTTGSDSNPGTLASPWALTAINTKQGTYAGKRVGLLDGTYGLITIMGQPTATFDKGQLHIAGGSAGNPTVIQAVNARQATLDWQRSLQSNNSQGSTFNPAGDYVTIDGLVFANNNYRCIVNQQPGSNNVTVQNCYITGQDYQFGTTGANSSCIYNEDGINFLIHNCRFNGGTATVDSNRHNFIEFFGVSATPNNMVVEYCTFIGSSNGTNGSGEFVFGKDAVGTFTVRNNYGLTFDTSTNSSGDFMVGFHQATTVTGDSYMYNNCFVRDPSITTGQAYVFIDTLPSGLQGNHHWYNNTFIGKAGGHWHLDRGAVVVLDYYNNIEDRLGSAVGLHGDLDLPALSKLGAFDYNLYPSSPALLVNYNAGANSATGLAAWQTASGKESHSVAGSPIYVNTGTDAAQYQLTSGSAGHNGGNDGNDIGAPTGRVQIGSTF